MTSGLPEFSPPADQSCATGRVRTALRIDYRRPKCGHFGRLCDGFWRWGEGQWRNTRVSAVLLVTHLKPWNATDIVPELWLNPKADPPNVPVLPHWSVMRVIDNDGVGTRIRKAALSTAHDFWHARGTDAAPSF